MPTSALRPADARSTSSRRRAGVARRPGRPGVRARPLLGALAFGLLCGFLREAPVRAQEIPIDRWLVTGAGAGPGYPLAEPGTEAFPDRDLVVGPGYWSLVREDGRRRIDLGARAESGAETLAHAYLRADRDATVRLRVEAEPCATVAAWLNGQALADPAGAVRLGAGWNTLLVRMRAEPPCPRILAASLAPELALRDREARDAGPAALRVQASRPPGIRRTYPAGAIVVGEPDVTGLAWRPGGDDLSAALSFALTAWGRAAGTGAGDDEGERPAAPPSVDLSGEWRLTVYGPVGIRRLLAELEMDEDGELSGELRPVEEEAERPAGGDLTFAGEIREGWVSGERFAWTLRLRGPGSIDLLFRGDAEDGRLVGSIEFEGEADRPGGFESRFEGRRPGDDAPAEAPGGPPEPGEAGAAGAPDADEPAGPTDPEGLRARMIRQLLPPESPGPTAPSTASVELRVGGARIVAGASELTAAVPHETAGAVPFRELREAALDERGLEADVRWGDGRRELEGSLPAEVVLRALHGPIGIAGLADGDSGRRQGEYRLPDALAGFTLRVGEGRWWVDGAEVTGGTLCAPCARGRRLRIGYEGEAEIPSVSIADPGFPDRADRPGAPPPIEWLRALEGDNRRYRELAGG